MDTNFWDMWRECQAPVLGAKLLKKYEVTELPPETIVMVLEPLTSREQIRKIKIKNNFVYAIPYNEYHDPPLNYRWNLTDQDIGDKPWQYRVWVPSSPEFSVDEGEGAEIWATILIIQAE